MIKVNLDTNIIIKAMKPEEVDHNLAIRLIEMHKQRLLEVQIIAANASEYKRSMNGGDRSLEGDLLKLGLQNAVKIVPIPAMAGMGYLGHIYLSDDTDQRLLKDIWAVLWPRDPFNHRDFCAHHGIPIVNDEYIDRRWRNHMCDVLTVKGYIDDCNVPDANARHNFFITTDDDDILKNAVPLATLGAKRIFGLKDGLLEIEQLLGIGNT